MLRDLLSNFQVTEVFAFLAPGAILLSSFSLWIKPRFGRVLGDELASQPIIIAVLALILAYALGMIISSLSTIGSDRYILLRLRERAFRRHRMGPKDWLMSLRQNWMSPISWLYSRVRLILFWFFFGLPVPLANQLDFESRKEMVDYLEGRLFERFGGIAVHYMSVSRRFPTSIWDLLQTYRTAISRSVADVDQPILTEAEVAHRKLMFALGVGLAVLLLAFQSGLRLILYHVAEHLPEWERLEPLISWSRRLSGTDLILLYTVVILATSVSFALRWVSERLWQQELFLMNSLPRFSVVSTMEVGVD